MRSICLILLLFLGCAGDPLTAPAGNSNPEVPPAASAASILSFEPARPRDYVAPITAINVEFPTTNDSDTDIYLVEGEVSQASLNRLENGELTTTLAERVVPSITRAKSFGWRLRPLTALSPGVTYSVVSRFGAHGSFHVGAPTESYLTRIWGPLASLTHVYCGATAPTVGTAIALEGSDLSATLLPGLDDDGLRTGSCIRIVFGETVGENVQLPPEFAGHSFDPTALPFGPLPPPMEPLSCSANEIPIGPGCGTLVPGAIVVRAPARGQLWALRMGDRFHLQVVKDGERFVIPELGADSSVELQITVFDEPGRPVSSRTTIALSAPQSRIVINEVMANPVGVEPAQEWIEVANAGTASGDLSQLTLEDAESSVALPSLILPPGGYALLVRDDFDVGSLGPVPENLLVVRLPQLSKGGLTNAGEALRLIDESGQISAFPAVAAKIAGVSVARRYLWSLDDDPASFALHGAPGASPGTANGFDP